MRWMKFNAICCARIGRISMAALALAAFSPRVQAQLLFPTRSEKLFGGIPEPSMWQYANLWEGITGLPWREQTSTLFLGEQLPDNTFELVAHQVETEPSNGIVMPVGTVEILEQYPYTWLLPYSLTYEIDDNPDVSEASMTSVFEAASVLITANNGFESNAVAGIVTMTITATVGGNNGTTEETVTVSILVPLGLTEGPVLADQIAKRIAAMAIYDGDPIDPNTGASSRQPNFKGTTPVRPSCSQLCQNAYNTAKAICRNNFRNDLNTCALISPGAAIVGCATAARLCTVLPLPPGVGQGACCVLGGLVGVGLEIYICTTIAQNTFDTCLSNAFLNLSLCLLNNCNIIIADD